MCGVSLDIAAGRVLGCRCVLAGGAAAEPGRDDGVVPAVGAQPTAPGHRCLDGEGDPQLRLGGAWVLDRLWERLGIGAAVRRVAEHRKIDGELAERVVFALVAQRALEPGSKLAGTRWVAQRVFIEGLPAF